MLSLRAKAQLLLFNERCSSSPCQQPCVTTTGWRHLVSPRGASAVRPNLQSCHFTVKDEPSWRGELGPHNGPSSCLTLKEKGKLDDICVLVESSAASCFVALQSFGVYAKKMNQSITFSIIHRPRRHVRTLERPSKVSVAEMTGLPHGCHERVPTLCPTSTCMGEP